MKTLELKIPPPLVAGRLRFQIVPEERVLASLFGADYATYTGKVGRWL